VSRRQVDADPPERKWPGRLTRAQLVVYVIVAVAALLCVILELVRPACGCSLFSPTARTVEREEGR
jgi:hypothetical protein